MDHERMNAWKWLGRARSINKEIETLTAERDETYDALTRITQNYESDGAQSSKDPHKFDKLAEYGDRINERIATLYETKTEILGAISRIENGKQRTVLTDYYIRLMTLEQIAVELGCTWRNVVYIRKKAVKEIEKIL